MLVAVSARFAASPPILWETIREIETMSFRELERREMSVKLCLNWRDYETNMRLNFGRLRQDHNFCDVTLVCEEGQVEAHRFEVIE